MAMFDRQVWAAVPFHFWSVVVFVFGSIAGSFLNVCIYRMPRGESVVSPPSHCPACNYHIPWFLNMPLITWVYLRGRCAHCRAAIAPRYFLVELLTASLFLGSWLRFGQLSAPLALAYCVVLAGFIVATFIDLEFFIIPDEITLGGIAAGFLLSALAPGLHETRDATVAMQRSFLGILVGGGLIYAILQIGKLFLGRQQVKLEPGSQVVFGENSLKFPGHELPYEEIFHRKTDTIVVQAASARLGDRSFENVTVELRPSSLRIGEEIIDPETVKEELVVVADQVVVPREAMGFGDVKFMAAIGAFLGWEGVLFSLIFSSALGSLFGGAQYVYYRIKQVPWSTRIPYGPYIALAATAWIFGKFLVLRWLILNLR